MYQPASGESSSQRAAEFNFAQLSTISISGLAGLKEVAVDDG